MTSENTLPFSDEIRLMAGNLPISRRKRIAFRVVSTLILLLFVELVCRVIDRAIPDDRAALASMSGHTQAVWDEYQEAEYTYEPFALWRHSEFEGEHVRFDESGHRRTENPSLDCAEGRLVRIAFFGGSTMAGLGADDFHTLPSIVSRELAEKYPGVRFEAVNFGVGAYVSSQELLLFWRRVFLGEERWDLAVFYDGANEGWVSFWHVAGSHNYESRIATQMRFRDDAKGLRDVTHGVARELASQETLFSVRLPARIVNKLTAPREAWASAERGSPSERVEKAARVYRSNQRFIETMASEKGISTLFFLQPVASLTASVDDETLREYGAFSSKDHFRALYRQIESIDGSSVHDLSAALRDHAETFLDWCHLTGEGNEVVARAMLPAIETRLRERCLLGNQKSE